MMNTPVRVRVKIAVDQQQNSSLAHNLNYYLTHKDMDVTVYSLSSITNRDLEYLNYQWLILALCSDSNLTKSEKDTVDYARALVLQRRLQGILVITDSPSPDKIANLWPTLRIYDAQNDEAANEAFDKIYRTLNRRPSVSTDERAGLVTSLPAQAPARRLRSPLTIGIGAILIVALLVFAFFGPLDLRGRLSPSPNGISTKTPFTVHIPTVTGSTPSSGSDPTATATPDPQTLLTTDTKSQPTASYALTINSPGASDWQSDNSCDFVTKGYNIIASTPGEYVPCMLQNKNTYQDFVFQVQMQISPGGAGGLIFRSNAQMSVFYRFSVDMQGNYVLLVCTQCASHDNLNANKLKGDMLPKASAQYTITVIAIKNTIYLYINGTFLFQRMDSTSSSGSIGLYAASETQSTTAVFTNAKIWQLSAPH